MTSHILEPYPYPTQEGYYGEYGGRFVPETLIEPLNELDRLYSEAEADPAFQNELTALLHSFGGRPTPLTFANRLTARYGTARIYLKREDLCHTGAHKINSTFGQVLLARRSGKRRIVAETGAGQHGVAVATVAARLNLPSVIYMGEEDILRQRMNVHRIQLLGAELVPVKSGERTLKDAMSEALRDWMANLDDTFYVAGSVVGPHPYPRIVRDFQIVIGEEARSQMQEAEGRSPTVLLACVGGGSNAIGLFYPYLQSDVRMVGVQAGGLGLSSSWHAASLLKGSPGVLHGTYTYVLQQPTGQVARAHSISAGLDYPTVGPEHSALKDLGRVEYVVVTDRDALEGAGRLARLEGIIPALETAHAIGYLEILAPQLSAEDLVIVNLSGRGDKDIGILSEQLML